MRDKPMAAPTVTSHVRQVLRYTHLNQISHLCLGLLPLFPYTHTYSVIEPSIDFVYVVLHACYTVVVKPSSRIYLDFRKARLDGLYRLTGR